MSNTAAQGPAGPAGDDARFSAESASEPALAYLEGDGRGGFGSNGKPSLDIVEAAAQITRGDLHWGAGTVGQPTTVTYAFRASAPGTMPEDTAGFSQFSAAQVAAAELSLQAWSDVANIAFARVSGANGYSNDATILFGNYSDGADGAAAFAYMPGQSGPGANAGDVWINDSLSYNANPVYLGYGQQVLTHEIGHALGLGHPGDYDAGEGPVTYAAHAAYYEDSRQYTLMSYFNETNTGASFLGSYASAPLVDDIAAIQRLYGANMTTRPGDTIYGFHANADRAWFSATSASSRLVFAAWDAGGDDTFDFSGYNQNQTIDLRQGAFSDVGGLRGNVAVALGTAIENAVGGAGADAIIGNSGSNRLLGGAGADTLDGGLGADTVALAGPRSSYAVTAAATYYTVSGPDGVKTVQNVETLQFSDQTLALAATAQLRVSGDVMDNLMTGGAGADTLNGAGGADTIDGGGGDDRLDGEAGTDRILGGAGDDLISGGAGADTIDGGTGVDAAVFSDSSAAVSVNLLTARATGSDGVDVVVSIENVTGTAFSDAITGDDNANRIVGGGGGDSVWAGGGSDAIDLQGAPAQGGGAPDIVKAQGQANGSVQQAVQLDGGFDLLKRADVANSTTVPHATVMATTHGGYEYYAVTAIAGQLLVVDIDDASFDSTLRILDVAGVQLAINDDSNPDSGERTDSQISFTPVTTGVYYVQVGAWHSGTGDAVITQPPPAGETYLLHVSAPGHAVVPLTLIGSYVEGGAGEDIVHSSEANDTLFGGEGADFLASFGGADFLQGNVGIDVLNAGDDADTLYGGQDADALYGMVGDDWANGNLGQDTVAGAEGNDTLFGGQGDDLLYGEAGDDRLVGDLGADRLDGGAGHDVLEGVGENDVLFGFGGNDLLSGGDGLDLLDGDVGDDVIYAGADADLLSGGVGNDFLQGNQGADTLDGAEGDDTLLGGADNDLISAGSGRDLVFGDLGADTIDAGADSDTVYGGAGDDVLMADGGDALSGGAGSDRFLFDAGPAPLGPVFAGAIIVDLEPGERLSVNGGDALGAGYVELGAAAGYSAALAAANAALASTTVSVAALQVGADVYVFSDGADADETADSAIRIVNLDLGAIDAGTFV